MKNVFSRPPSRRVLVQDFLVDHPTCSTIRYLEIQELPVEQQDLVERQVGFLLIRPPSRRVLVQDFFGFGGQSDMQHNSLLEIQELQAKQQDLVEHQEGIRCWGIQVVPSYVNPTNIFFCQPCHYRFKYISFCSKQWPLELIEIFIGCINIIPSRGIHAISQH